MCCVNYMLLPHHIQDLEKSGLTEKTVEAAGLFSETDYGKLAGILNRKRYGRKNGPALVIPYRDEGGTTVLCRVRPDNPPENGNGHIAKYLGPTGVPNRVYFPPGVYDLLAADAATVFITEGEKKALRGAQDGLACIGLSGVENWHPRKSTALIPDLSRIAWKDRKTYIVFDSDAVDNENIRNAESLLAATLANHGADVKIVRLPSGPGGEKVGLDDYLVAHGFDTFWQLVDGAVEPEAVEPEQLRRPARDLDPATEARRLLDTMAVDGLPRLRFWRGSFWLWRRGAYREVSTSEVRGRIVEAVNRIAFGVSTATVGNILQQVQAQSMLLGDREPPRWLDGGKTWPADEVLAARNGLFHLPSIVDGKTPWKTEPTPRFFATAALDYDVDLSGPRPDEWFRFLESAWGDDPGAVGLLQQWLGYLLTNNTQQHKILFLIGPKRSGKGTIARVTRALIGAKNVCGPTLAALAGQFGLWSLVGKSLAIVSDARLSGRSDKAMVVERLLSVSGEDAIDIDRKCIEPLRSVKLSTRFMLLSNETPRLTDASGALASRMMFLRMNRSWYGKEDHGLTDRLLTELPSILQWAMAGWKQLRDQGRFDIPESGRKLAENMEELGSPVTAFVRDECVAGEEHEVSRADLHEAFTNWAKENGKTAVTDQAGFGRDLRAAVPGIDDVQHRVFGKVTRFYRGIGLKTPQMVGEA